MSCVYLTRVRAITARIAIIQMARSASRIPLCWPHPAHLNELPPNRRPSSTSHRSRRTRVIGKRRRTGGGRASLCGCSTRPAKLRRPSGIRSWCPASRMSRMKRNCGSFRVMVWGCLKLGCAPMKVRGSGANWIHRLGDWPEYLSSYLYSIARFYKKQNSTRQKEVKQKKKKNRKVNYMSCIRLGFTWYE